jgi:hypothetical protein
MPVYTLVVTDPEGQQQTTLCDFPDDRAAIAGAGVLASAARPSVALARDVDEVDFLGAWDWESGGSQWNPDG